MSLASSRLPDARIVRHHGAEVAPPPVPLKQRLGRVVDPVVTGAGYMIALWPLTLTVMMCAALIWAAGYHTSP